MRYLIEHETRLQFRIPVTEHQCELRLSPYLNEHQEVEHLGLETEPEGTPRSFVDCFGNQVYHFGIVQPHEGLAVRCRSRVRTHLANPFDYELLPPERERAWLAEALRAKPRLWGYVLHRSAAIPELEHLDVKGLDSPRHDPAQPLQTSVMGAMAWIQATFQYDPDATHVHSALLEVLEGRAGVCQDFAHLLLALVRSWGIPARYAMGYVDPGYFDDGRPLATHAWAEVLIPGAGWRGFDPSHGLLVNDSYILVAVGRDYQDAAPLRGSFKGDQAGDEPAVELSIMREE